MSTGARRQLPTSNSQPRKCGRLAAGGLLGVGSWSLEVGSLPLTLGLFAQRFGGYREDPGNAKGLRQIPRDPQINGLNRTCLGREPGNDDDRNVGLEPACLPDDRQAVNAGHLQVGDEQVIWDHAQPLEGGPAIRRKVHVVLREGKGFQQQISNRGLVVYDEDASASGHRRRGTGGRGALRSRPLIFEPGVDIALAETPLPADADSGDLSCLDQAIDGPEVDLKVVEYLLGRQEAFVHGLWTHSIRL